MNSYYIALSEKLIQTYIADSRLLSVLTHCPAVAKQAASQCSEEPCRCLTYSARADNTDCSSAQFVTHKAVFGSTLSDDTVNCAYIPQTVHGKADCQLRNRIIAVTRRIGNMNSLGFTCLSAYMINSYESNGYVLEFFTFTYNIIRQRMISHNHRICIFNSLKLFSLIGGQSIIWYKPMSALYKRLCQFFCLFF